MPLLSIYFIRCSLIYLGIGFISGGLLLLQKTLLVFPRLWHLLPVHIEIMIFGWIFQLVMGVGFWMLPRFAKTPLRGNEALVLASFILINLGIICTCLSVIMGHLSALALAGKLLELCAIFCFLFNAWRRVKPFGE